MNFYKLKVKEVRRETEAAVSIEFELPDDLLDEFRYIPGQYLTLRLNIDGQEFRRSYSICSSPYCNEGLRIAVKSVERGVVSGFLNTVLKAGDFVELMKPNGRFYTEIEAENVKNYVFFAGGSGITPIISIIKSLLRIEKFSQVTLFYGNTNESAIIFKSELKELALLHSNFRYVSVLEFDDTQSESIEKGRLTVDKVGELLDKYSVSFSENEYFVCGPSSMMNNVEKVLLQVGVNKKRIFIEYFSAILNNVTKVDLPSSGSVGTTLKFTIGEIVTEVAYDRSKRTSILETALEVGLDAPYSCKEAICCSCRAKVVEGKVKMKNNYALTDGEVDEGFVLTCQSYPLSDIVVINYDA